MLDTFTDHGRRAIVHAQEEGVRLHHSSIDVDHLFLGLCRVREGRAVLVLARMGLDVEVLYHDVEARLGEASPVTPRGYLPFSHTATEVLEGSESEARALGHQWVGTEHLLLALVARCAGVAAAVLLTQGVTVDRVRARVSALAAPRSDDPDQTAPSPAAVALAIRGAAAVPEMSAEDRSVGRDVGVSDRLTRTEHALATLSENLQATLTSLAARLDAVEELLHAWEGHS